MEDLKVTDIEIDKIIAPFIDVDADSDTIYFSERPNWETHKMEDQYQVYLTAMAEFVNKKLDLAFHQGQIEQLNQDIETCDIYDFAGEIKKALQDKLKSLESKH